MFFVKGRSKGRDGKQKIELERETAEKNEAFKRIQELDSKVNSAAILVKQLLMFYDIIFLFHVEIFFIS